MNVQLPKSIAEEDKRLAQIICNSEEDLSIAELVNKYASEEYKDYYNKKHERDVLLFKRGIIEN